MVTWSIFYFQGGQDVSQYFSSIVAYAGKWSELINEDTEKPNHIGNPALRMWPSRLWRTPANKVKGGQKIWTPIKIFGHVPNAAIHLLKNFLVIFVRDAA
jgi:hypothetical protein